MGIEGSIRISRMSNPSDPEPWTYSATFAPHGGGGAMRSRKCLGDIAVDTLLREVGITERRQILADARAGSATVGSLWLTQERLGELGLM
jgi:hypothetical protein